MTGSIFYAISGVRSGVTVAPVLSKCAFDLEPLVLKIIGFKGSKSASYPAEAD